MGRRIDVGNGKYLDEETGEYVDVYGRPFTTSVTRQTTTNTTPSYMRSTNELQRPLAQQPPNDSTYIDDETEKKRLIIFISIFVAMLAIFIVIVLLTNTEKKEILPITEEITIYYGTLNQSLNLRRTAGMGENVITQIPINTRVEVLDLEKHNTFWYRVKYNGQIGFIYGEDNNLTITTHTQSVTPGLYE